MPKPPEIVTDGARLGVKVYLCKPCAAKLREHAKTQPNGRLASVDLAMLCMGCQKAATALLPRPA